MLINEDARTQRVQADLHAAGIDVEITLLPDSAATAQLAADALGIPVGAVANSLVFWADEAPLLVMTSGAHRVDTALLAQRLGKGTIRRASAAQVTAATGQQIGGVSPAGHPAPLEIVIDEHLATYEELWAAGGTAHAVFPLHFDDLVRLTGGAVVAVN